MLYRPRMAANLSVATIGSASQKTAQDKDGSGVTVIPIRLRRASLELNDHNHADSLKIQTEWADAGFDPRILSNATIDFYMGNADARGLWNTDASTLRFTGIATRVQRQARKDEGFVVDMEFLDYTTLFLKAKPFPNRGIPDLSQTLDEAWRRICDHVGPRDPNDPTKIISQVGALRDALLPIGLGTSFPKLGASVAPRLAKLGSIPARPEMDAWAVWQACVGSLGLISYVRRNDVIVAKATDYYNQSAANPPRMVWAKNIFAWQESRRSDLAGKGVGITSYDPLTGTAMEAVYPPFGDERTLHKRISAKKAGDDAAARAASDYEYFAVPGISNQRALEDVARRVYEERSRQELEGTFRTVEMFADRETDTGAQFDLLNLGAGDVVRVEFDQFAKETVPLSIEAKKQLLMARGYSDGAADVIARNYDDITRLSPTFLTKRVQVELDSGAAGKGGSFEVEVSYCNRIQISGDTDA